METEIQDFLTLLRKTYEREAWHGPSVKEAIGNISDELIFARLPGTHSIIELVAHMTAWRRYAIKKLMGESDYTVTDEMNFPNPDNWQEAVRQLEESQEQLVAVVEQCTPEKFKQLVPGTKNPLTFYTLLHGIIHHDLYHTGQIMLIRKANTPQSL